MNYADVILPLPLEGCFTYSVPEQWRHEELAGRRVVVPLGKVKTYTAIVARCHDEKPGFKVRDILAVPDAAPVLLPVQLQLWQWIADYYLAPVGEVYKAALPAGLKAEDGYRPRMETFVALAKDFQNVEAIQAAKEMLARARKQLEAFEAYLELSRWDDYLAGNCNKPNDVSREELLSAHANLAVVTALCAKGILEIFKREPARLNVAAGLHEENINPLSPAQKTAFDDICGQFKTKPTVLLHGITSSGKTEIYIHLIRQAIARGEQVLYLLPEIALTVQIMQRLKRVFGDSLGIYHSRYSDAQRVELWQRQLSDSPCKIILGARSAMFLPFKKLGLIIIDEEHESSFKQQEPTPRYHARSAALMLAKLSGARTLLGTATPSMESYRNALTGKYGLVRLTTRHEGMALPEIEVVDVKDLRRRKMMRGNLSPQLYAAIRQALADNRQVILFQNRRGWSREVECKTCGWVPRCTDCDVALTLHRTLNLLSCHYCGRTFAIPAICPACGGRDLINKGLGTERVEDEILAAFPEARIARMDLDSTRSTGAYNRILDDFAAQRTNVLVGTQMVTKGLDFDRVDVVGIIDADTLLNKPDFRAYEQAFQMMTQVSGRAGRKGRRGKVFLQTKNPDLPVIKQIVCCDYGAFYRDTAAEREYFRYPPFSHIIRIELRHSKEPCVQTAADTLAARLRSTLGDSVLGPDKPSVARVKKQHIRTVMLKIETNTALPGVRVLLRQAKTELLKDKRFAAATIIFDVDPL